MEGLPDVVDAVMFDLDGVLTDTASVHRAAWKSVFDELLAERAHASGGRFSPFTDDDYLRLVDGKSREDGARAFLASRGLDDEELVRRTSRAKDESFAQVLHREGVTVFPDAKSYLESVSASSLRSAVVTSSRHGRDVIHRAGIDGLVDAIVDGNVAREHDLRGKPQPDSFVFAVGELGSTPARGAVFEDAVSGVEAGRAGGFACVVGVDRVGHRDELTSAGADVVVSRLTELTDRS
jgi:beta-phosphoglucomutase family hydrolase